MTDQEFDMTYDGGVNLVKYDARHHNPVIEGGNLTTTIEFIADPLFGGLYPSLTAAMTRVSQEWQEITDFTYLWIIARHDDGEFVSAEIYLGNTLWRATPIE